MTLTDDLAEFFKMTKWKRLEATVKKRAPLPTDAEIAKEIFKTGVKALKKEAALVKA